MIEGRSVLAVVPARGGSKGIPRKNLQLVAGVSLVARVAKAVAELEWIDASVLSTDDEEIADEGRRHGLDVPFLRPGPLSGDTALAIDVWQHAWLASEAHYGRRFDISMILEPTSPLRRPQDVERTVRTMLDGGHSAAATVSPTPAHYTPHKTLTVSDAGIIGFYLEGGADFSLRQGIPRYYHRNGLCYAAVREHVVDRRMIIDRDAAAVIVERRVVNIDEPFELDLAGWLLERGD